MPEADDRSLTSKHSNEVKRNSTSYLSQSTIRHVRHIIENTSSDETSSKGVVPTP